MEKEKLKTLKEIGGEKTLWKVDLKAEAVKWVKMFRKKKYWEAQVKFMLFFNLTEEDLE